MRIRAAFFAESDSSAGFSRYTSSTPFGQIISLAHNLAQKLFESHVTVSQTVTALSAHTKKRPYGRILYVRATRVKYHTDKTR